MGKDSRDDERQRLLVATEKLDPSKRKKVPRVTAVSFPFCGTKADS